MKIKHVVKAFIPPVFFELKKRIKIKLLSKNFYSTVSQLSKMDNLYILGNGPSLKISFEKYEKLLGTGNCIVVNHFCETEWYEKIQPAYYLLADPAFFTPFEILSEQVKKQVLCFLQKLIEKTTWKLNLIVPSFGRDSEVINKIKIENKNISFYYYNNVDYSIYHDNEEKFKLWDINRISPPAQTVLNTCVWLGIFLRCKNVYLLGADTNWIEYLHVDQENNMTFIEDTHFYGKERRYLYEDLNYKIPQKFYKQLYNQYNAFKCYDDLSEYAKWAGVNVYNASEYSLIDVFERKSLKEYRL